MHNKILVRKLYLTKTTEGKTNESSSDKNSLKLKPIKH